MPYCRYCDQEYPAGTETCPACHHLLLPARPQWLPYDPDKPLVEVATTQGALTAELVRGKLEVAGVPTTVQRESAGVVFGLTVDGLGAQHILVPEDLVEEAQQALVRPRRAIRPPRRRKGMRFTRMGPWGGLAFA